MSEEYINGYYFFRDIDNEIRMSFDNRLELPWSFRNSLPTVECIDLKMNYDNRYRIKKKNINLTIDILQDKFDECNIDNSNISEKDKIIICGILQKFKVNI